MYKTLLNIFLGLKLQQISKFPELLPDLAWEAYSAPLVPLDGAEVAR